MTDHRITFENAKSFIGRKVQLRYGAYFPTIEGEIFGTGDIGGRAHVLIMTEDGDQENSALLYDNGYMGIGIHLVPENENG